MKQLSLNGKTTKLWNAGSVCLIAKSVYTLAFHTLLQANFQLAMLETIHNIRAGKQLYS
jgi:hypothetical protein